ncbi:MAG: ABC transporter permease [Bacteroidetes bacterium]|nr:ABC transporter permease [Bacteroidota bacterium]
MSRFQNLALRFLHSFCPPDLVEEIEGDLLQRYGRDAAQYNESRAGRRMLWNAIRFFRPGILIRNKTNFSLNLWYMIGNYFKVASRVMVRNKSYSAINIFGLAMGITGAILLFLWIQKEFSYDQFHADKDRIYKAWSRNTIDGQLQCWDHTPRVLAPALQENYSSVEEAVSYADYKAAYLFTVGNTRLMMNSGAFTEPKFFTMFSFPLVKGDPTKVFDNPASVVLTESFAKKLFGDKDAFDETVTIGESGYSFPMTVSGIVKDLPSNTDFHFDYLIPFKFMEDLEGADTNWENSSVSTYVKLKKGSSLESFNREISGITKKHSKAGNTTEVFLYPLTKMRLYSRFENGVQAGGRIEVMRIMGILGVCLIVIACINFINLSTARAQKRSKEVGIRKVTGANRSSLILQFICESVLVALGAGVLSIMAVYLTLPLFSTLVRQQLSLDLQNITFWGAAFTCIVFVGIMAGGYPAFYLSSFNPVKVLKGSPLRFGSRNFLRKFLVVLQFGFAVTLIFSVVVIQRQLEFVQNRETGYTKDNLIYHYMTGDIGKNYAAYKTDLLQSGAVESVTKTNSPITEGWSNTWALGWHGKDPQSKILIDRFYIDEDISKTAGLKIIAGRDMNLTKFPSDSTAILLNESAAKIMGFKNPINEIIEDSGIQWHVVGVVKDFILSSPFQKVRPMAIMGGKGWFTVVHIKLNSNRPVQESISAISKLFTKHNSAYPFDYYFVDQAYNRKFADAKTTLTITTVFGSLAISIACLGLLGLSTYMIESRIKEIGIRKVMGSSAMNIVKLLSTDTLKPILIALVLFSPQAWWSMNWWLQSFDYRISISPWIFVGTAAIIVTIAMVTIGSQTVQAAKANPVNSLRSE